MASEAMDDAAWESLLATVEQAKQPIHARQEMPKAKRSEIRTHEPSTGEKYRKSELECFFDGCCEPRNPGGHAGYGALIRVKGSGEVLTGISGYIPPAPETSNNVGEYSALLSAFKWLREAGLAGNRIDFYGDSKLVINQVWGDWRIKAGFYVPLAHRARREVRGFPKATGTWIPREENTPADELSKAELVRRGVTFRIQPRG